MWDFDLVTQEVAWSENAGELFGVPGKRKVSYDFFLSLLDPLDQRTGEASDCPNRGNRSKAGHHLFDRRRTSRTTLDTPAGGSGPH